jgi:cytochrome c-type biogenesis protein CcmH/NrfG
MADAADAAKLPELAIWLLEYVRGSHDQPTIQRSLARLYEQRGDAASALALWEQLHQRDPNDREARRELERLLVHETTFAARAYRKGSSRRLIT